MRLRLLAALVLLAGCAIGRVTTPAGVTVEGWAFANAYMEACLIPPPSDIGPMPEECAKIQSTTATNLGEIIGAAITGALAYFTSGAVF